MQLIGMLEHGNTIMALCHTHAVKLPHDQDLRECAGRRLKTTIEVVHVRTASLVSVRLGLTFSKEV